MPLTGTLATFGDEEMEGIVFHHPSGKFRVKYVTKHFKDSVDNNRHWKKEKRIKNKLLDREIGV